MENVTSIVAGYTLYGYYIEVGSGEFSRRECFGNCPYESTTVIPLRNGRTLPLENIKKKAELTAMEMAEELGVKNEDVYVFHDTDEESNLREEFE